MLKLRQPSKAEVPLFKDGSVLYSFLYPKQNQPLIDELAKKNLTAFGMDCVPRISRAQVFDALSSMGNISGYRAVVEAANHFGRPDMVSFLKFVQRKHSYVSRLDFDVDSR